MPWGSEAKMTAEDELATIKNELKRLAREYDYWLPKILRTLDHLSPKLSTIFRRYLSERVSQ